MVVVARGRAMFLSVAVLAGCSAFIPNNGPLRTTGDAAPDAPLAADGGPDVTPPTTWTVAVGPNGNHVFAPSALSIRVGDTVHWVWQGSGHTVTSGTVGSPDGTFCSPSDTACSNVVTSSSGATYDHVFATAGTFPYFCMVHGPEGMTGSVTAQ